MNNQLVIILLISTIFLITAGTIKIEDSNQDDDISVTTSSPSSGQMSNGSAISSPLRSVARISENPVNKSPVSESPVSESPVSDLDEPESLMSLDSSIDDEAESSDLSLSDDFLFQDGDSDKEGSSSFKIPQDAVEFMDYFDDLVSKVKGGLEKVFEKYLPVLFEMSSSIILSPDCTYDVVRILLALREMKPWAIKLLDASGKVPEGILSGTLSSLGDYDECLDTKLMDPESEVSRIVTGQYCSINIKPFLPPKPPSNSLNRIFNEAADAKGFPKKDHFSRLAPIFYYLKFRLGVCIPSSCTKSDLATITNTISMKVRLNVTADRCEVKETYIMNQEQLIAGSILLIVLSIVLIATISDVIRRFILIPRKINCGLINYNTSPQIKGSSTNYQGPVHNYSGSSINYRGSSTNYTGSSPNYNQTSKLRIFLNKLTFSFSAYTNCSRILSSKVPDDSIRCLYGLKVINLVWIIFAHAYLTLDLKAVGQLLQTQKVNSLFIFQIVMNASLAVESFFFISGLLVTITILRKLRVNPRMSLKEWSWFYLHRLIRMTPAVGLVIAIVVSAFQLSDGPLWREIIYPSAERCKNNWWIHILHISNFFDVSRMCFLHLWYIAADMQLFFITPFLVFLLHKKPYFGRLTVFTLTLVSIVSTGVVTYLDHLPPTLLFDNPDPLSRKPFGNLILVKPYPHAAPYFIGILSAYFIHMKPDLKLKKWTSISGWIVSTCIILTACFITWNWNQGFYPSQITGAIYAASFRSLWALAMAWIVIACHYGHGGVVSTILNWIPFVPMSRVSYTAYLIHPGLMYVFVASTRNLFMFGHFLVMYLFLAHLLATFLASFLLSLVIEIPFIAFEQSFYVYFFGGNDPKNSIYRSCKYFYNVNPDGATGVNHVITSHLGQVGHNRQFGHNGIHASSLEETFGKAFDPAPPVDTDHKTSTPLSSDRIDHTSKNGSGHGSKGHHNDHMNPSFPLPVSSKYHHHVSSGHHVYSGNHGYSENVLTQRIPLESISSITEGTINEVDTVLTTESITRNQDSISDEKKNHCLEQKTDPLTGRIYSIRL